MLPIIGVVGTKRFEARFLIPLLREVADGTFFLVGFAQLAKRFGLPVVLTTTDGGAGGSSGPLLKGIIDTFPDVAPINRMGNLNAMDDPRFAAAVHGHARPPWQGMQYMRDQFSGRGKLEGLDDDRYADLAWTPISALLASRESQSTC